MEEQSKWEKQVGEQVLDKYIDEFEREHGIEYFYVGGQVILQKHVNKRISGDVMFALGSFVFVWLYMWYHTESVFLASTGMSMVVFAFPAARSVTKYCFGVVWFDFLNQLLLFLLLGIGADTLFVILDAYRQSSFLDKRDPAVDSAGCCSSGAADEVEIVAARLSYTLKRARHATLTTSVTTAGAFFANLFSGIMPTAGFGIFAGTMIMMNFLYCIIFFPAAIAAHHYYFKRQCRYVRFPCFYCCPSKAGQAQSEAKSGWSLDTYSVQERFFYSSLAPFVKRAKIPLLVVMCLFTIAGVVCGSLIETAKDSPQFMAPDDLLQITFNRLQCTNLADHCYQQGALKELSNIAVMVWGLEREPDRSGFTRFEDFTPSCENYVCGSVKWDYSFDLTEPAVQELIRETCDDGLALKNAVSIEHCVMADLQAWINQAPLTRGSFPVPKENFNDIFQQFLMHEETKDGMVSRPFRTKYQDSRIVGMDGTNILYIMVGWRTPYILKRLYPSEILRPNYEEFMSFEKKVTARFVAINGGGSPWITESKGHEMFLIMETADEFTRSVYRGIAISLCVALVMLIFSTRNLVIAAMALVSIGAVTCCTIGSMFLYGWELGIIEAICAVLVVGFSVDYTVHYGIAYMERRPHHDGKYNLGVSREDRMQHSFFELGTSILGGTLTTLGASTFLFMCRVMFFRTFGIFIFTVIFWSFLFAHFFFMPLCALLGPEGTFADIKCPTRSRAAASE
jgi:predicted RND superfamily exporter protein